MRGDRSGHLGAVDTTLRDRDRNEQARLAKIVVVEEIHGARTEVVHVQRPSAHRNRYAELVLLVPLAAQRHEAVGVGWVACGLQRGLVGRPRSRQAVAGNTCPRTRGTPSSHAESSAFRPRAGWSRSRSLRRRNALQQTPLMNVSQELTVELVARIRRDIVAGHGRVKRSARAGPVR